MLFAVTVTLIAIFLLVLLLLLFYQKYSKFYKLLKKIPGPVGHPLLGNYLTDFAFPAEEIFSITRQRALQFFPIYKQWSLHLGAVSILHPRDIELILSSPKHMKKSRIYDILHAWLGTGLLTSDGPKWKSRRKMLTPAFHFSILQNFIDIFNQETEHLNQTLQQHIQEPFVDVIPFITDFTLKSMAETSMGVNLNFQSIASSDYKKAIFQFGELTLYRVTRPWMYSEAIFRFSLKSLAVSKVVKVLHDYTKNVISERQKTFSPKSDLSYSAGKRLAMLDLLLTAKEEGAKIDDDGIREEVDTFMFEGHDTTSVAICYILMMLANHKEVQEEVRQEIIDILGDSGHVPAYNDLQQLSYTERVIKECLRLYPSVPLIARDAREDIETSTGYVIPKGSMIHIHIFDIHRNPTLYPDPLKFDPDRFLPENTQNRHPYAYIPFSAGPRNCIGQKFAMLELKAVLCGVLRKFILEPVDKPEDIVFLSDLVLRSRSGIRIKFLLREK